MYPEFVEALRSSEFPIDYRACGAVDLAFSDHEWTQLTARAESQRAIGIPAEPITEAEVRQMIPAADLSGLAGAMFYPDDAIVNASELLSALYFRRGGGVTEHNSPAISVDAEKGVVETASGGIQAEAIVLAAGAWSSGLLAGAPNSFPVKGHLIGYELPPASLGPIVRHGHTYILQRSSGFTIAGSTMERVGFDASVNADTVARLHQRANRYLPKLLRASPDVSWIGFRPAVDGDEPQVGRFHDTKVWLAYGHYRNGILLTPITAQIIASEISASLGTASNANPGLL